MRRLVGDNTQKGRVLVDAGSRAEHQRGQKILMHPDLNKISGFLQIYEISSKKETCEMRINYVLNVPLHEARHWPFCIVLYCRYGHSSIQLRWSWLQYL